MRFVLFVLLGVFAYLLMPVHLKVFVGVAVLGGLLGLSAVKS